MCAVKVALATLCSARLSEKYKCKYAATSSRHYFLLLILHNVMCLLDYVNETVIRQMLVCIRYKFPVVRQKYKVVRLHLCNINLR